MTEFLKRLLKTPQGAIGTFLVVLVLAIVVFGPLLAPYDPEKLSPLARYKGPSLMYWLGTDQYGRDIFSRLLIGARATVVMAVLATIAGTLIGALIGTLIGVLPGLGPIATIAMLLPATYALPPLGGLIMLAGIYYGAQYGGSTTAILVNLPGETSSVVTCIDGYQMARRGRAGVALSTAAIGSFFAGCVGTLLLAAFAVPSSTIPCPAYHAALAKMLKKSKRHHPSSRIPHDWTSMRQGIQGGRHR